MHTYRLAIVIAISALAGLSSAAKSWSECSKPCGYGVQTLEFCAGFYGKCTTYSRACKIKDCGASECDKPCGGGRKCQQVCTGSGNTPPCHEICEKCNDFPCVPNFGEYSECTKECGGGTQFIVNPCDGGTPLTCPKEYRECNNQPCPPAVCANYRYNSASSCCEKNIETCGTHIEPSPFQKIFGGDLSSLGEWPWLAVKVSKSLAKATCGGTLIHRRYVLSAAHCMRSVNRLFQPIDFYILLGTIKISDPSIGHVRREIVRFIIHENYVPTTSQYDIGLIELDGDVTFSSTIQPACLPKNEDPPEDFNCIAAGFGISNEGDLNLGITSDYMSHVELKVLPMDICKTTLAAAPDTEFITTQKNICAGRLNVVKDTCQGDSGGPLMCQRCLTCGWYIAGITSFGISCGGQRPGVYTKVKFYQNWIRDRVPVDVSGLFLSCDAF